MRERSFVDWLLLIQIDAMDKRIYLGSELKELSDTSDIHDKDANYSLEESNQILEILKARRSNMDKIADELQVTDEVLRILFNIGPHCFPAEYGGNYPNDFEPDLIKKDLSNSEVIYSAEERT